MNRIHAPQGASWIRCVFSVALLSLCFTQLAEGKLFRNAYISFELPTKWKCGLEATDWICVSEFYEKNREAMIVLTAKEVGPSDTLQAYIAQLNVARTLPDGKGRPISSQVIGVKNRVINHSQWIDGMHLGSEVPGYYTRYLATIKNNIGILVTFSAHKTHYTKYSQDFLKAIQSLQVVANKSMLNNKPLLTPRSANETYGAPIGQVLPTNMNSEAPPENSGSGKAGSTIIGLSLLAVAGIYYFLSSRRKKRRP